MLDISRIQGGVGKWKKSYSFDTAGFRGEVLELNYGDKMGHTVVFANESTTVLLRLRKMPVRCP